MKSIALFLVGVCWSIVSLAEAYDPMMPPSYRDSRSNITTVKTREKSKTILNLRQILMSERGHRAVINGYVVKEGSYIANARVSKIQANQVTLVQSGKEVVLNLNSQYPRVRR